jgi:hypothetical protein
VSGLASPLRPGHTKLCFAILRESGEPLSASRIARRVAERKSVAFSADLVIKVRANLMRLAREERLQKSRVRRALKWGLPAEEYARLFGSR